MSRSLRIVDFDLECLPGHWIGGDYVSKIVTAAAFSFVGEDDVAVWTHYDHEPEELGVIAASYIEAADLVTGHYIRGFDLPLVNGALIMSGEPSLDRVMTIDTKLDLRKNFGRSQSQENLCAMLGIAEPKITRTLAEWEGFNLRRPGFEEAGIERVVGDVIQHKALYQKLVELDWLGSPRAWSPEPRGSSYRP